MDRSRLLISRVCGLCIRSGWRFRLTVCLQRLAEIAAAPFLLFQEMNQPFNVRPYLPMKAEEISPR